MLSWHCSHRLVPAIILATFIFLSSNLLIKWPVSTQTSLPYNKAGPNVAQCTDNLALVLTSFLKKSVDHKWTLTALASLHLDSSSFVMLPSWVYEHFKFCWYKICILKYKLIKIRQYTLRWNIKNMCIYWTTNPTIK